MKKPKIGSVVATFIAAGMLGGLGWTFYKAGSYAFNAADKLVHGNSKKEICAQKNAEIIELYSQAFNNSVKQNPMANGDIQLGIRYIMTKEESPHWSYSKSKASCPFVQVEGPAFFGN